MIGLGEWQQEDGAEEQQGGEDEQESRAVLAIPERPGKHDTKPFTHGSVERPMKYTGFRIDLQMLAHLVEYVSRHVQPAPLRELPGKHLQ